MATPSSLIQPPGKSKRILELDALRAIAALNLLLFHFTWVYQEKYGFSTPLGFTLPYGKYGVQLFFMLSGFVNAMTLLRRRSPTDFVAGRFIRIFPSFWLVVAINVWLLTLVPMYGESVTGARTLANMTVMPGLFGHSCMEPVTWTLQVEMLFYGFLLILLVTGLIDKPLKTLMGVVTTCYLGSLAIGWINSQYPDSAMASRFAFLEHLLIIKHLPLFAMGMLLNEIKSKRGKLHLNIIGILFSAIVFHSIDERNHNPAATVLLFGLLTMSAYGRVPVLRMKLFTFLSTISYSLYLFHNNLGSGLIKLLDTAGVSPLLCMIIATLFSVAFGAAITYWLEQPVTQYLRGKWSQFKKSRLAKQDPATNSPNPVPIQNS